MFLFESILNKNLKNNSNLKTGQSFYFDWTSEEEGNEEDEENNVENDGDANDASLNPSHLNGSENSLSNLMRRLKDRPWFKQPKEVTIETVFKSLIGSLIMRDPGNNDEISLIVREIIRYVFIFSFPYDFNFELDLLYLKNF